MSDPVLAFVVLALFFAAMAGTRYFKTLDPAFARAAQTPFMAGLIAGALLLFVRSWPAVQALLIGISMALAAVWVRRTGDESEATDGMILGAVTGAAAAIPLAFSGSNELRAFAQLVVSGTIAGYGVTYAAFHVGDRTRQIVIDAITTVFAIIAAYTPVLIHGAGVPDRDTATVAAIGVPLAAIAIVFQQWQDVRAELAHEAALGFIADADVRTTAHPLKRFGRGAWTDAAAHREFVRVASKLALRKRQQRNRADEVARLYQLEIIKLRMLLQEMANIDRAARAHHDEAEDGDVPSDKMRA